MTPTVLLVGHNALPKSTSTKATEQTRQNYAFLAKHIVFSYKVEHTHMHKKKQSLQLHAPALGHLCTTQVLAGKSSRDRTSNPQGPVPYPTSVGAGTQSPTCCSTHGQLAFASQVNTRYSLMLQLGGLLPQLTPGPFKQLGRQEQCE